MKLINAPIKNDARPEAVRLLQHYFRTAFEGAGLKWNSDNDTEVGAIVDAIIDATGQRVAVAVKAEVTP